MLLMILYLPHFELLNGLTDFLYFMPSEDRRRHSSHFPEFRFNNTTMSEFVWRRRN